MIVDKIVKATKVRVEKSERLLSLKDLKSRVCKTLSPFAFEEALKGDDVAFICELKKASPSKGIISADFPFMQIAHDYEKAGASALSVLTEPDFFLGRNEYLTEIKEAVKIPVLRKDFIVSDYQIYESRLIGADAILLICSILKTETIREYIAIAESLGMSCLVEAHNEEEVASALDASAKIIGVNNRNLQTFEVDINNSLRLRKLVPPSILFVSESGISCADDIDKLRKNGTNAVLIGETLMRCANKKEQLELLKGSHYDKS